MNIDILQQGEEGKYRIKVGTDTFDPDRDDFSIVLSWGLAGKELTIDKADMQRDYEGYWFFMFPTDGIVGMVTVECISHTSDEDDPDGTLQRVDRQRLCFVAVTPCPRLSCGTCSGGSQITYERITGPDVTSAYQVLCDVNKLQLTVTGSQRLRVLKPALNN